MNSFSPRYQKSGSALLIVLAFIVIIAIVLLAFMGSSEKALKQSDASAALVEVQLLSDFAMTSIVEDIRAEMKHGASEITEDGIMTVTNSAAMIPERVLKDSIPPDDAIYTNLIKQSVSGKTFFTDGPARASAVNSGTQTANGYKLSANRWSKPQLLGNASGGAEFKSTELPDWILITRNGAVENGAAAAEFSKKSPENKDYTIGRFAYNIYDIGGLLDINVAGFDPDDADSVEAARHKGSMALADLRAIPGLGSQADVTSLVTWRNKSSRSDYLAMIRGLKTGDANDADRNDWGEPGGFWKSYTTESTSDNRFVSRQDLLSFFENKFQSTDPLRALPFLTTFSADLDKPSFAPHPDQPEVQRTAANGGNDGHGADEQINPSFLKAESIKRRFPLERLKYLTFNGPTEAAKVATYFGLSWVDGAWQYGEDRILTLGEIPATREPNFFELLKAAIGVGSLGGQYELEGTTESPASPRRISNGNFLGYDGSTDLHIMKIGANIIDQYDTDSYPTRIQMNDGNEVSGIENLPYLYRTRIAAYRLLGGRIDVTEMEPQSVRQDFLSLTNLNANRKNPWRNVVFLQPTLWNPHAPGENVGDTPTELRVVAETTTPFVLAVKVPFWGGSTVTTTFPSLDPRDIKGGSSQSLSLSAGDYINFTFTDSGPSSFREPYTLRGPNLPVGSQAATPEMSPEFELTVIGEGWDQTDSTPDVNGKGQAIGFRLGYIWTGPYALNKTNPSTGTWNSHYLDTLNVQNATGTLLLQYRSGSNWITYDSLEELTFPNHDMTVDTNQSTNEFTTAPNAEDRRSMRFLVRLDPRTTRYNVRGGRLMPYVNGRDIKLNWPEGRSMYPQNYGATWGQDPTAGGASSTTYGWTYGGGGNRPWGLISENKPSGESPAEPAGTRTRMYYLDPDGVQRRAMGGHSSGVSGSPMAWVGDTAAPINFASRPVILNRPFRSVAELGYAFRDQPWKQLDFWTPESADKALLDVFCIYEPKDETQTPRVSGRVNLNSARNEVLQAILKGVAGAERLDSALLSDEMIKNVAERLVSWRQAGGNKGPFLHRSDLVGRLGSDGLFTGFSSEVGEALVNDDSYIQIRRQSVMRALADGGTTRSWNFLIDLIVQSGFYPADTNPNATNDRFRSNGEMRAWVHLSIDRFTGEIIAKEVERVNE